MEYRVQYAKDISNKFIPKSKTRLLSWILLLFCLSAVGALLWTNREQLITAVQLFEDMARELEQGSAVVDVFETFYQQFIQGESCG